MTRTTKARLLAGGAPEPYEVPALGGEEVLLRPLSASEAEDVQSAQVAGIRASQDRAAEPEPEPEGGPRPVGKAAPRGARREPAKLDLDFSEVIRGNYQAETRAASYGLVDPELSLDEVRAIRPYQVVEQIGQEVMRRSGLGRNPRQQLAEFRELAGRSGDADASPDGIAAGGDAG